MAPNNGPPNNGPGTTRPENNGTKNSSSGSTTVLPKGTVESRGMGTHAESRDVVSKEIQDFLHGEGKLSFWAEVRGFFTVWMFVTRLPSPSWVDVHPGYLMRGMTYLPISGTIIGIIVSSFYDISSLTLSLPLTIASIISEVASLWVTGCFHEDGLADSADGIGGGWTTEQILKIMMDTRLGTFGCAILLLYIVGKLELIAILGSSVWGVGICEGGGPAIIVTQTLARLVAPMLIKTRDYVDEGGPKYQFYSFFLEAKHLVTWSRVLFATLASLAVSSIAYGLAKGATLIIVVTVIAFFSGRYGDYILGGVMGDYLGGTICVTEVCLLTTIVLMNNYETHASLLSEMVEMSIDFTRGVVSIQVITDNLINNDQTFALLKFVAVVTILAVWRSNVGHPPIVFVKKTATKDEKDEPPTSTDVQDSKSSELEAALLDSKQDFTSRYNVVRVYLDSLAKPVGSLGLLEDWAARIAALQRTTKPKASEVACLIFAADHGVAKDKTEGGMNCSAYPQIVSRKVLEGLDAGIAGASVLSKCNNVALRVIDVGLADGQTEHQWSGNVVRSSEFKVRGGTSNFCTGNAMTGEEVEQCISVGRNETGKIMNETGASVIVFGEVGIGNTTTSSALIAALTGAELESMCGSGASTSRDGINDEIVSRKIAILKEAMQYHGASNMLGKPKNALKFVGGAEITAIIGGMLEASDRDVPILVDGFIVTTAAMIACELDPAVCRVLLFATQSTEKGQEIALDAIASFAKNNDIPHVASPALNMNLRMGEATGALAAVPLVRSACAIMSELATLDEVLGLEAKS